MTFQLRFADATLDADLLDGGPKTLILEPTVRYALCRTGVMRPDGCMPVAVRDPKVSACHFILSFLDGRWRVEDGNGTKRSTNGTLVDGEQIGGTLTPLTPGSVITAQRSKTSLYFEAAPVAAPAEAAETQTFSQEAADSASASRCGSAIEAAAVEEAAAQEVAFVEVPEGGGGTASQPEQLGAAAPPPPVGSKLTVWSVPASPPHPPQPHPLTHPTPPATTTHPHRPTLPLRYEDEAGQARPWVGTMVEKFNRKKDSHHGRSAPPPGSDPARPRGLRLVG